MERSKEPRAAVRLKHAARPVVSGIRANHPPEPALLQPQRPLHLAPPVVHSRRGAGALQRCRRIAHGLQGGGGAQYNIGLVSDALHSLSSTILKAERQLSHMSSVTQAQSHSMVATGECRPQHEMHTAALSPQNTNRATAPLNQSWKLACWEGKLNKAWEARSAMKHSSAVGCSR